MDPPEDAVGEPDRLGAVFDLGHQDRELLAPDPRRQVAGAALGGEDAAEADQAVVPRLVPEAVVDGLESVEVEHHQADRPPPGAPRALELLLEALVELTPIRQPGEGVGAREVVEVADHDVEALAHQGEDHGGDEQRGDREGEV